MAYKILVVDDDPAIRELLTGKLVAEGFQILQAANGEDALKKVDAEKPDIVLLDLVMPGLNGFEVLRQIRSRCQDKWIPVIIFSGQEDLESLKQAYALEADHYITKPCDLRHVVHGIQLMISLMSARKKKGE